MSFSFHSCLAPFALAAAIAAQTAPQLAIDVGLDKQSLRINLLVQGPPSGFGYLLLAPGQLQQPIHTPWGSLFVQLGNAAVLPFQLDRSGTMTLQVSLPHPIPQFVVGMQAIVADAAFQNVLLSNPAAISAADTQTLTYGGGKYKTIIIGKKGDKIEIKAVGDKGTKKSIGGGVVLKDGDPVTLEGGVPATVGTEKTTAVEVWVNDVLVMWVAC